MDLLDFEEEYRVSKAKRLYNFREVISHVVLFGMIAFVAGMCAAVILTDSLYICNLR